MASMHLKIRHEIHCRFDTPARNLVSILRLSPRSHEGQHVSDWWIDSDIDCSLKSGGDEFGNLTHTFSATGPITAITIAAAGLVDTFDMAGVTRGTAERMPLDIYLRDTPLTSIDADLRHFADEVGAAEADSLGRLHTLMDRIHETIPVDPSATGHAAAKVFAAKSGNADGHAHVFIAAARHLSIPSRYISGYLVQARGANALCHSWAEAFIPGLGWVGFDPVNNLCPQGEHVRVATGFDSIGAAFIRGPDPKHTLHSLKITAVG